MAELDIPVVINLSNRIILHDVLLQLYSMFNGTKISYGQSYLIFGFVQIYLTTICLRTANLLPSTPETPFFVIDLVLRDLQNILFNLNMLFHRFLGFSPNFV